MRRKIVTNASFLPFLPSFLTFLPDLRSLSPPKARKIEKGGRKVRKGTQGQIREVSCYRVLQADDPADFL